MVQGDRFRGDPGVVTYPQQALTFSSKGEVHHLRQAAAVAGSSVGSENAENFRGGRRGTKLWNNPQRYPSTAIPVLESAINLFSAVASALNGLEFSANVIGAGLAGH